ncbi:nuclear transport factor 2 family protein [Parafrankia sp. BMG5.11]|uniref:nuclear transport factor 2 family protein n=1 Tax=Parafrankia sp. BMG5.11 TaxID=222540 RepID=UPI001038B432|nr:nuclear transport factor 2 family protein [Parafrankia sp. BMG5.11]TCJ31764.1 nuclear transport factor 2 family protein [Parafrankia sp. BMG5.11]
MDIHTLSDIEEIKQLKARYLRLVDEKNWDEWADVFTEDLCAWLGDVPDQQLNSRDEFITFIRRAIGAAVTIHHGHMPEIEISGPDTARGIWAMYDYVKFTGPSGVLELDGYGHYREEYRKGTDGRWRICSLRLTRILGMVEQLEMMSKRPTIPASRDASSEDQLVQL